MTTDKEYVLASKFLGNERRIWISRHGPESTEADLLLFLDGERYRQHVGAPEAVETLFRSDVSHSALVVVYVSEQSEEARWRECPCYPPFADFAHGELLPWLRSLHPEIRLARRRTLVGLSYTGLAASYLAFRGQGEWTHVISQSGSYWSNDCWLTRQIAFLERPLPVRFRLEIGLREKARHLRHRPDLLQPISQIEGVHRFRSALLETGHDVTYVEFDGGHDYNAWRETLPSALSWAVSPISQR